MKRDGRFSGEAYVLFGTPAQVQAAVEKNKSYMGRRYVEVFRAKKLVSAISNHLGLTIYTMYTIAAGAHAQL